MTTTTQPTQLDDIHAIPGRARRTAPLNVGARERWLSTALGAVFIGLGLRQKGVLGLGSAAFGGMLAARGVRGHCPAYAAFGLSTRRTPGVSPGRGALAPSKTSEVSRVERSVTVARPPDEVYQFLHDVQRIPEFAPHVARIEELGGGDLRVWTRAPDAGPWEAHIDLDEEARLIALHHPGTPEERLSILFAEAPGGRGTEVRVTLDLGRERSLFRRALAAIAGEEPDLLLRSDLRRMKMLLEAGEIVTVEGQPSGHRVPLLRAA